ncbi:MAG: RNA methyltransferase, partial [Muribaculaceae bacterium]|nr:RNA methyltransferase [Muribaculaceae bacterium]
PSQVMAIFKMPGNEMPEIKQDKLYLLLDGVQDPGNLGTIIRTYDWFGVDTIFASDSTVDVFNPKTVQSTMGSLKRVEVHYTDLGRLIERYPDMPVYGTVLDGRNIYKMKLNDFGFIVMGNEGNGITDSIKNKIKIPLLIPPYDKDSHAESLNVAIATAVVLSTFRFG